MRETREESISRRLGWQRSCHGLERGGNGEDPTCAAADDGTSNEALKEMPRSFRKTAARLAGRCVRRGFGSAVDSQISKKSVIGLSSRRSLGEEEGDAALRAADVAEGTSDHVQLGHCRW